MSARNHNGRQCAFTDNRKTVPHPERVVFDAILGQNIVVVDIGNEIAETLLGELACREVPVRKLNICAVELFLLIIFLITNFLCYLI